MSPSASRRVSHARGRRSGRATHDENAGRDAKLLADLDSFSSSVGRIARFVSRITVALSIAELARASVEDGDVTVLHIAERDVIRREDGRAYVAYGGSLMHIADQPAWNCATRGHEL